MNRLEKIEAIYKEVANKELSFGCRLLNPHSMQIMQFTQRSFSLPKSSIKAITWNSFLIAKEDFFEIIWHPVMIGDVFDYMFRCEDWTRNEWIIDEVTEKLIMPQSKHQWWNKRKPIEEQSEECKEYVYNLLTNA